MKNRYHDYPFLNGIFIFWVITTPWLIFFLLLLMHFLWGMSSESFSFEDLNILKETFFVLLIAMLLASFIANSLPAIHLTQGGIEVRYYFPLLTRWIYLPWDSITSFRPFEPPAWIFFSKVQNDTIVTCNKLPTIYYLAGLLCVYALQRSFIIGSRIKDYNQIVDEIATHGATRQGKYLQEPLR